MAKKKNIAVILGARPNFMKAAPFLRRAKEYPEFNLTIIHTGQHFDPNMSKIFFEQMGMPAPDVQLSVSDGPHTERLGKMFSSLRQVFRTQKFDGAVVFGDVNSTLAGALAATKHCPLIHIEAGLRSHDRRMPEEINRVIVDHLSKLLFTTEPSANENLLREQIDPRVISYVGNLMIENLELFWDQIQRSSVLTDLGIAPRSYVVATIHRQENVDSSEALARILTLLNALREDQPIVFPLHPGTKNKIQQFGFGSLVDHFQIVEPLGYFDFMKLVSESRGVVTDSGGIQEETSHLGIPCATLRDNTERPITLTHGSNRLFSLLPEALDSMRLHLARTDFVARNIPLWDREVSQRIFTRLHDFFG